MTASEHPASSSGGCPVDHTKSESSQKFLEASSCSYAGMSDTPLNPLNNMPNDPEQTPAQGQQASLSTEREKSTIPMGAPQSKEKVWVYPSEQMFFNAMKRKKWDPKEHDMKNVVSIHNAVNEECWRQILEWEKIQPSSCGGPKLIKFEGKPTQYTPKALFWRLLGYKLPFDRHDWTIDRCGEKVTYVIDFYSGAPDPGSFKPVSMFLDVRPAFTPSGIVHRIKKWWNTGKGLF